MTAFRPCIDLHHGHVKQIVGASLRDDGSDPSTNFVSEQGADWYADLYRRNGLNGAHVIQLGPGNQQAARSALAAWPDGLQLGGGITIDNASDWIDAGARQVILTSWLFDEKHRFQADRLATLADRIGPERIVVDLSCRGATGEWRVTMNRWQTPTNLTVDELSLTRLARHCSEFLVHAADVEGLRGGMDEELIRFLGQASPLPVTYAGGASALEDLKRVQDLSDGRVDLTIGSALDIFGGEVSFDACVQWNRDQNRPSP